MNTIKTPKSRRRAARCVPATDAATCGRDGGGSKVESRPGGRAGCGEGLIPSLPNTGRGGGLCCGVANPEVPRNPSPRDPLAPSRGWPVAECDTPASHKPRGPQPPGSSQGGAKPAGPPHPPVRHTMRCARPPDREASPLRATTAGAPGTPTPTRAGSREPRVLPGRMGVQCRTPSPRSSAGEGGRGYDERARGRLPSSRA